MADYKLYTPEVSINVLCRISTMYKKSMLLSYLLSSKRCRPPTKYWVRGQVLETHSMADYMLYTLDVSVNVLCRICTMFTKSTLLSYLLSSKRCRPPAKYWVRGQVLETHCRAAFMKQVLPRLLRPVAPLMVGTEDT